MRQRIYLLVLCVFAAAFFHGCSGKTGGSQDPVGESAEVSGENAEPVGEGPSASGEDMFFRELL